MCISRNSSEDTDHGCRRPAQFTHNPPLRRVVTTGILVLLVATVIPYQFAYLVLCLVQLVTCVRGLRHVWEMVSTICTFAVIALTYL